MKFLITKDIFNKIPNMYVGVVIASNVNNAKDYPEIEQLLKEEMTAAQKRFKDVKVKQDPQIIPYREAFRKIGINPNRYPCSVEALFKRLSKGKNLPQINPLVDLNNALSMKYTLPMGTHTLDGVKENIEMRLAEPGDTFEALGSDKIENPDEGEVVYAVGHQVRTRRWTWRQSKFGMITPETKTVFTRKHKNMAYKNEYWTVTSGDLKQKRTPLKTPEFTKEAGEGYQIVIDPIIKKQKWDGVGAAVTDAAASLIWKQSPGQRKNLLEELFSPAQGNFNLVRIPMGSCDFGSGEASDTQYYSYDDVPYDQPDLKLEHFSIGTGQAGAKDANKDLKYIVPILQEILRINPNVKILATPWSAPAWMKNTKRMEKGGHFRKDIDRSVLLKTYAQYFVKFLEAYQKLGVPICALCIQNEPNFATPWPAMIWTMPELADFGAHYLKPALSHRFPKVELYFWDGSLDQLDNSLGKKISPEEEAAFAGLAFHTYFGPYENINNVHQFNPCWKLAMTERRCMLTETIPDASHIMMGLIGNYLVRCGLSSIYLWNLALDERGLPNIAGSTGRRGVITIDHQTGKVQRNLEYYMLRNFAQDVLPGSLLIKSSSYMKNSYEGGLSSTAFLEPDGSLAAQVYNPTSKALKAAVTLKNSDEWQEVIVPAYGTVTLHKSNGKINESLPRADEDFKLNPIPAHFMGDAAPGKK